MENNYIESLESLPNWFKEALRKYLENHKDDEIFAKRIEKIGVILSKNGYQASIMDLEQFKIIKEWAEIE